MKIPYIISKNTIEVYKPSTQTFDLIGENLRKLLAENSQWDDKHCPSLEEFCIEAIAKNYQIKPLLDQLPCHNRIALLDVLPLDLPLEFLIPLIDDEHYWKRRYLDVFKYTWRSKPENWTWKGLYIERHCQKLVEEAEPQYNDEETFDEILTLCNPYMSRLFVEQLQTWKPPLTMEKDDIPEEWPIDHINLQPILKKLTNIQQLEIVFGMKNVDVEEFKWAMFKITIADCQKLGKAIQELPNLKIFRLHRSNLEFAHCQALVQGLIKCPKIEHLDLSHCRLADTGALCIAFILLQNDTRLKILNLTNNGIKKIGAEGLGYAIMQNRCNNLEELNLRLNPLGNDGTMAILRMLVRSSIPQKLNLAGCMFEEDTPMKICQMIKLNDSLKWLDISSNYFGAETGNALVEAAKENLILKWLDVRETDITEEQRKEIVECLERNKKRSISMEKINNEEIENYNFQYEQ